MRRIGDRVRISAELVRASDSTQIWSQSYIAKARDAANRALQLDNRLSEAHASLAYLKVTYSSDGADRRPAVSMSTSCRGLMRAFFGNRMYRFSATGYVGR